MVRAAACRTPVPQKMKFTRLCQVPASHEDGAYSHPRHRSNYAASRWRPDGPWASAEGGRPASEARLGPSAFTAAPGQSPGPPVPLGGPPRVLPSTCAGPIGAPSPLAPRGAAGAARGGGERTSAAAPLAVAVRHGRRSRPHVLDPPRPRPLREATQARSTRVPECSGRAGLRRKGRTRAAACPTGNHRAGGTAGELPSSPPNRVHRREGDRPSRLVSASSRSSPTAARMIDCGPIDVTSDPDGGRCRSA